MAEEQEQPLVPEGGGKEEASFPVLPVGFYDLEVHEVEAGYGKDSGKEYVTWIYLVENEEFVGSKLWHRTSMSDRAKSFPGDGFYAVLNRLNLSDTFAGRSISFEEMCEELADVAPGIKVKASVQQVIYQGEIRNEITEFFAVEGGPEHKVFPEQALKLEGSAAPATAGDSGASTPASPRAVRDTGSGKQAPPTSKAPY